jgi:serine/threonine-protein kinase HipA
MVKKVDTAKIDTAIVKLWGDTVGAVSWLENRGYAIFEYEPNFLNKGLDVSPIHMSLDDARNGDGTFSFPSLNKDTFLGLPGMLADALPDKFGNNIIDAWLSRNGRDSASFSPVERLCYTGKRGMGALEFLPPVMDKHDTSVPVEVSELVQLAQEIMQERKALDVQIDTQPGGAEYENAEAILDILRVGTSAGGARPKAVIAIDDKGKVMSGQAEAPKGYDYWLLKFDGVMDLELGEPPKGGEGYGRIEYAYYRMAKAAGINMMQCQLLEENGRAHFMTKRFDRVNGKKQHMQTLCGIAHYDFNMAGVYSYEQTFAVMRQLRLSKADAAEQYRRMIFNIIARDLDDHTKNISFLMNAEGKWKLSPAYDVIYSHNPAGKWTNQHQMSVNGKRDHFTKDDLIFVGESISLSRPEEIINDVITAVEQWSDYAKDAGIKKEIVLDISKHHRTNL